MENKPFGLGNIIKPSKEKTPLADKSLEDKNLEENLSQELKSAIYLEDKNDFLAPLGGRKGRKVNLELTDIQFALLDKASKHSRYSKRALIAMALKEYLEKNHYL